MKNYSYILPLLFLLIVLIPINESKEWDPKSLAELPDKDLIIDTNSYLNRRSPSYTKTLDYIKDIMDKKNIQVYVYFIDSISQDYKQTGFLTTNINIDKFVNDLAFHVEKGHQGKDKNSIFVVFSVNDRKNRIRTGENVKKIITNDRAASYLKNLKSKLRSQDYTGALEDLLYEINWRLTKNTFWYDFMQGFLYYLFLFGMCFLCCFSMKSDEYRPYEKDSIAENKLEKIKKISESNKNNIKFVEDNCIICLEEFNEEEKNKLLGKKNDQEKKNKDEIKEEVKENLHKDVIIIEDEEKGSLLKKETNPKYGKL